MMSWLNKLNENQPKKALPILSFPSVSLLDVTVFELVNSSDLQALGMKAVADKTDSAAAVSFMDLSVEAECFGADVVMSESEVPTVKGRIVNDLEDAKKLPVPAIGSGRTQIYIDAVKKASKLITDRPVFAGMIGPFSLAARLLDVSEIMMDCYDEPEMVHLVLDKATTFLIEYARGYKMAGANGIVMAEPVSGLLSPSLESEFSSPYIKKIVEAVQDNDFIVVYHNCGANVHLMVESILSTGSAAYHFGNAVDMKDMLDKFPKDVVVMGNIDPAGVLQMGTPEKVRNETLSLLEKCSGYKNFVLSSGCDIPPNTPWDNIDAFFAAVNEFYEK
ncbi:MAG: uroporphyrinogen decarboxylase family protein [Clostridia bacterium]|nr:uroporphyrinogen decarboxylase family protein [Clostridia bacterium]